MDVCSRNGQAKNPFSIKQAQVNNRNKMLAIESHFCALAVFYGCFHHFGSHTQPTFSGEIFTICPIQFGHGARQIVAILF